MIIQMNYILTTLLLWSCIANFGLCKQNISILGLIPENGTRWTEPFAKYSAQLALNHINQNSTILSEYFLKIDWVNTMCDGGIALKEFVDSLARPESYVAVFGGGCAVATSEVAGLSHNYGLTQIAYATTAPNLGDDTMFPRFVRGVPSDVNVVPARAKFIVNNNWKRVAIVNQQDPIFVASSHIMELVLGNLNIEYRVEDFASDAPTSVQASVDRLATNLIDNGYRIIIANMYEDAAVKLFCSLYKQPKYRFLLHPHSTWIFLGWFTDGWHNKPEVLKEVGCSAQDVVEASNGALGFLVAHSENRFKGLDSQIWTEYGLTVRELYEMYRDLTIANIPSSVDFNSTSDVHEAYVYDSLWSLALSLNRTQRLGFNLTEISQRNFFQDEAFFTPDSPFSKAVYEGMLDFTFNGWSGRISYVGHERFDDRVQLLEFVNGRLEFRYEFSNIPNNSSQYSNISGIKCSIDDATDFVFWNASVATDGIFDQYIHPAVTGLVAIISVLIACYITFYIIVIAIGRIQNLQSILNSRATLTCSILAGNYLLLLSGVFYVSNDYIIAGSKGSHLVEFRTRVSGENINTEVCDSPVCTFLCMFPVVLLLTGASIIFGGMIGKAATIYLKNNLHFSSLKILNKMVTTWPFILAGIDLILVLVWSFVAPLIMKKEVLPSEIVDPPFYRVIQCRPFFESEAETNAFVGIAIFYKSILVLIGTIMAYNLRNVKKKSLKYWNTITWTMYNMATFTLVLILCFFLIPDHTSKLTILGFLTLTNVLLTTTITGLPPVYTRFRDPYLNMERIKSSGAQNAFPEDMSMLRNRCQSLQMDKDELEAQLENIKQRISVEIKSPDSPPDQGNIFTNNNATTPF